MSNSIFTNPYDMESYINKRVLEIENLDDRKLYREVAENMMLKMYQQNQEALEKLEKRVFDEVDTKDDNYSISIGITDREHYDEIDEFLFPIFPEDLERRNILAKDIMEALRNGKKYPISSVYVQAPYPIVKEFGMDGQQFDGNVKTSRGEYRAVFKVKQERKYFREIQKLYESFLLNGKLWESVCTAYLEKMFTVCICRVDGLAPDEEINEIVPDFERYKEYIRCNMVPLWNINTLEEKSSVYPVPCVDTIHYEHRIKRYYLREDCSYLVSNTDTTISNFQRTEGDLTIICSEPEFHTWSLYKVNPISNKRKYAYPVFTNQNKEGFVNRLSQLYRQRIRSRAEISRIIEASNCEEYLLFQGMELRNGCPDQGQTYDMEHFIDDKLPFGAAYKTMLLTFSAVNPRDYLNYDVMSYLVTKVQNVFPEYHCIGVLSE